MPKKPKKEAVEPEEPKGALTKAKETVMKAAEKVAEVTAKAAEAVQGHVVDAVKPKKEKKPRFVREKKGKPPESKGPALPPRSTKATARLMTRGIALPPKEDTPPGQKPRA